MSDNPFDGPYGEAKTEYEKYLRVPELLSLQKPPERRSHEDELHFQVVHQASELWMKLTIHCLGEAHVHREADRLASAVAELRLANEAMANCERTLRFFELMPPNSYIEIRKSLGRGSGLESPGFNRINEVAPQLWQPFVDAVARHGADLLDVYESPDEHREVFNLAEELLSVDSAMIRFKNEHILVVKRIVGIGTSSLKGNPSEMLTRSSLLTYYPMLWAVRERLFMDFKVGKLET